MTEIKGVGRRYANLVCKKADVDLGKRCVGSRRWACVESISLTPFSPDSAGELNPDELERIVTIMQNPAQFKIPAWFVNRQRCVSSLGVDFGFRVRPRSSARPAPQ